MEKCGDCQGERYIRRLNGNGKNTIKIKFNKIKLLENLVHYHVFKYLNANLYFQTDLFPELQTYSQLLLYISAFTSNNYLRVHILQIKLPVHTALIMYISVMLPSSTSCLSQKVPVCRNFTLRILKHQLKGTYAPQCSQQYNLQQPVLEAT